MPVEYMAARNAEVLCKSTDFEVVVDFESEGDVDDG
jgi:hypothetical protein